MTGRRVTRPRPRGRPLRGRRDRRRRALTGDARPWSRRSTSSTCVEMAPREAWGEEFRYGVETYDVGISAFAVLHWPRPRPPTFATPDGPLAPSRPASAGSAERRARGSGATCATRRSVRRRRPVAARRYADARGSRRARPRVITRSSCSAPQTWELAAAASRAGTSAGGQRAQRQLEHVRRFAPDLTDDTILASLVKSPPDIERLEPAHDRHGTFHGGDRSSRRSGRARPAPGWAPHRMPIPGLYQTGGTTHPGGSVTGAPGRNAAMVMLEDLGHEPGGGDRRCRTRACRRRLTTGRRGSSSAGVDYNDFVRTTARIERWEEWLAAWARTATCTPSSPGRPRPRATGVHRRRGLACARRVCVSLRQVRLDGRRRSGNRAAADARRRRALAEAHELPRPRPPSASRCRSTAGRRRQPAPARAARAAAARAADPGLDSTKEEFFRLENVFLDRGMATLSLDGPGQGETRLRAADPARLRGGRGRGARRARRPRRRRPRPRRPARRQPRRLLRAARGARSSRALKAVVGISGPYNFGEHLGRPAAADARDVRGKSCARTRRTAARRRASSTSSGVRRAPPAGAVDHRQARPPDPVGADRARSRDEAPNGEFVLLRGRQPRLRERPLQDRPLAADWLRKELATHVGQVLDRRDGCAASRSRAG